MTNLHAHVSTSSSDCDGSYSRAYDVFFNDAEIAESAKEVNDFSDINFMNRVFANEAGPYAVEHAEVEIRESGFTYYERTDEGFVHRRVSWCTDDCEEAKPEYRDHRAESMGY